jgi:hypothetical protein
MYIPFLEMFSCITENMTRHSCTSEYTRLVCPVLSVAMGRSGGSPHCILAVATQRLASVSAAVIRRKLNGTCHCAPWLCSCLYSFRCSYCCCLLLFVVCCCCSSSCFCSCSYSSSYSVVFLFFLFLFLGRKGKTQIFWKVSLCLWVSSSRRFQYKVTMILRNVEEYLPNDTA